MEFTIPSKLPSLNEYIAACRGNKYAGAKFKKDVEAKIGIAILTARAKGTLRPTSEPLVIHFTWHEKTKRRDADNIASAKKYILDAMQKYGIIPNDSRRYIKGFTDKIVDDSIDCVEVSIEII